MPRGTVLGALLLATLCCGAWSVQAACSDVDISACVTQLQPWVNTHAGSEQLQPIFFGKTPREIVLGLPAVAPAFPLLDRLNYTSTLQAAAVRQALVDRGSLAPRASVSFEAWPIMDDSTGLYTWAFARYSTQPTSARSTWEWLDSTLFKNISLDTMPYLPESKLPVRSSAIDWVVNFMFCVGCVQWHKKDFSDVFADFLTYDDLYQKPVFGDCIWTNYTRVGNAP